MFFRSVEENAAAAATVTRQNVAVTRHKRILMTLFFEFLEHRNTIRRRLRENAHAGADARPVRWSGIVFLATYLSSLAFASGSPLPP